MKKEFMKMKEDLKQTLSIYLKHYQDGFLILVNVLSFLFYCYFLFSFSLSSFSDLLGILGFGILMILFYCTNYQCIAHNFVHNPFFFSSALNALYSSFNSLLLGMPLTLYRIHHMNHHRYNNDKKNPYTGTTKDLSSLFRHSHHDEKPEGILSYSLKGVLRTDLSHYYQMAKSQGLGPQVRRETFVLVLFNAFLLYYHWRFFFFFHLPTWFFGQALALAENYFEHFGADPDHRKTDSVSCYNKLYNRLWFNNGYHQEHHYKPTVHWTKIPSVRTEMLPETQRRVVKGAHFFNLPCCQSKEKIADQMKVN